MKHILFLTFALLLMSCGDSGDPASIQGAWLGEGTFHSSHGDQAVKAQLEVLNDQTYRFLVLEPRPLMLLGVERGDWSQAGGLLHLSPSNDDEAETGGLFPRAKHDFRLKSLTIEGDLKSLLLKDDKMDMQFDRNPKATAKLKENGEVD